jgi:pyridoxine/pyridoxamine 5'-phosphate oxidase
MTPNQLLQFLREHRLGVQASVSDSAMPQAAVVGVAVTDRFELVFDALDGTRKVQNLRRNPGVALVIGGWHAGDERTAQIEGVADEPTGAELERIKDAYYAAHPDGRERASWPGMTYVRVRPTWIRYSDYNVQPPVILELAGSALSPAS